MKNMLGITGLRTKIIEVQGDSAEELNEFLEEYDGYIIDIQAVGMLYGWCKFVILYKAVEWDKEI
jgi:hypothetical protein